MKVLPWKVVLLLAIGVVVSNGVFLWWFAPEEGAYLQAVLLQRLDGKRERGFLHKTYIDEDGKLYNYSVFIPYDLAEADRPPLMLYLNGKGENGSDGLAPLTNSLAPLIATMPRTFPFVVVWPQCPKGSTWQADRVAARRALAIMRKTAAEYHTDPDRVCLTGLSSGGWGVWSVAAAHPRMFSAIVPISASRFDLSAARTIAEAALPVWSVYVKGDADDLVRFNREMLEALLKAGASPHYTELDATVDQRLSTHNAWDFAFRNPALLNWMFHQRRSLNVRRRSSFRLISPAADRPNWIPRGGAIWSVDKRADILIGRVSKTTDVPRFLRTTLPGEGEIHLEFRPGTSVVGCGLAVLTSTEDERTLRGWALNLSADNLHGGGLFDLTTGRCLLPCDPASEKALNHGVWNDLRVKMTDHRFAVELNGWPLFDVTDSRIATAPGGSLAFLVVGKPGSEVRWRRLRVCHNHGPSATVHPRSPTRSLDHRPMASQLVSLSEILDSWRRRERSTQTAEIMWHLDRSGLSRWSRFRAGIAPRIDLRNLGQNTLRLSERQIVCQSAWWYPHTRVSRERGVLGEVLDTDFTAGLETRFSDPDSQRHQPLRWHSVRRADGRTDIVADGDGSHGIGIRFDRPNPADELLGAMEDLIQRPPLLAFRPFSRLGFRIKSRRCQIESRNVWADGASCLVIRERVPICMEKPLIRRYWVDTSRDNLILRSTTSREGRLREQIDIDYFQDGQSRWIPRAWTVVTMHRPTKHRWDRSFPGQRYLFDYARADVDQCVLNRPEASTAAAPKRFVGAKLYDQRSHRWIETLPDGSDRDLTSEEIMQIAVAGRSPETHKSVRWKFLVVSLTTVLFLMLARIWIRHRRRPAPPVEQMRSDPRTS